MLVIGKEALRSPNRWDGGYLGCGVQLLPVRQIAQKLLAFVEMSEFCWEHCDLVAGRKIFIASEARMEVGQ